MEDNLRAKVSEIMAVAKAHVLEASIELHKEMMERYNPLSVKLDLAPGMLGIYINTFVVNMFGQFIANTLQHIDDEKECDKIVRDLATLAINITLRNLKKLQSEHVRPISMEFEI